MKKVIVFLFFIIMGLCWFTAYQGRMIKKKDKIINNQEQLIQAYDSIMRYR